MAVCLHKAGLTCNLIVTDSVPASCIIVHQYWQCGPHEARLGRPLHAFAKCLAATASSTGGAHGPAPADCCLTTLGHRVQNFSSSYHILARFLLYSGPVSSVTYEVNTIRRAARTSSAVWVIPMCFQQYKMPPQSPDCLLEAVSITARSHALLTQPTALPFSHPARMFPSTTPHAVHGSDPHRRRCRGRHSAPLQHTLPLPSLLLSLPVQPHSTPERCAPSSCKISSNCRP